MVVSPALLARRALVKLLLSLAAAYSVPLGLDRNSPDLDVSKACRRVFLKVHPDKGGSEEHAKQLNAAKGKWEDLRKTAGRPKDGGSCQGPKARQPKDGPKPSKPHQGPKAGQPKAGAGPVFEDLVVGLGAKTPFRIQSVGVLLTYFGVDDLQQWERFVGHVRLHQKEWSASTGLRPWNEPRQTACTSI